jgi:hypothetical protein
VCRSTAQAAWKTNDAQRSAGENELVATTTANLANIALVRLDSSAAERLARQALEQSEALASKLLIAAVCWDLTRALVHQDKPTDALPYARRAVALLTDLRSPDLPAAIELLEKLEGVARP